MEMIKENTLLIDTEGSYVGQINGLTVMTIGDYTFGKPAKITVLRGNKELEFENIKVNDYLIDTPQNVAFFLENLTSEGDYQIFEEKNVGLWKHCQFL